MASDTAGKNGLRVLENAAVRLLKRRPFYGHLLLSLRRRALGGDAPLGVTIRNGIPTLYVQSETFAGYPGPQQEALLIHVLLHLLHRHPLRGRERHARAWDLAADTAINPGIDNLPSGAALPAGLGLPEALAAEEYYRLLEPDFDTGNLEGRGIGTADPNPGDHGSESGAPERPVREPLDDHRIWKEAHATPAALGEEVIRDLVQEAHRQSRGEVPGEVRDLVGEILAPAPVPWRQVLRQFVATAGRTGRRSTWKREHRRFGHDTPGLRKRRRLNLLVAVDVSDSTNERELREAFAAELVRIARGRESRITVLYTGSRIQKIAQFAGSNLTAEVYEGGGFTDLRPAFAYARTMQPPPAAVIYLTDGLGPAPERMEFPTLWALTAEGRKPADWGVELRLDL